MDCAGITLPFANPDLIVTKELNVLEVSNRKGVTVSCDAHLSLCSVTLDGWLHGELADA